MSTDSRAERLAARIAHLYATDAQFAAAKPSDAITRAVERPEVPLLQIIRTVMEGYADRPALAQRAVQFSLDPDTGRRTQQLLPHFETLSYRQLWDRARAFATASSTEVGVGDRVCLLGRASVDYTIVDLALIRMAALPVPLQTSAPISQLRASVAETTPTMIASSIESLADAVELALTAHAPHRLVVFDYRGEADDQRAALADARAQLADSGVIVETLAEAIERGNTLRRVPSSEPPVEPSGDLPALLIYTSGSTGSSKGVIYPRSRVTKFWRKSDAYIAQSSHPSITLNFMPMSHVMGREVLYGTLANGGTAYFVAKNDLSTLFEDLALVRPTELDFVPRAWEMICAEFQTRVDRRLAGGGDRCNPEAVAEQVKAELRQNLLGGRFVAALTSSAPSTAELKARLEYLLEMHVADAYGSTETGMIWMDGQVQRPPVLAYKLVDVPDLGYFLTDQPFPRGELLVKTEGMFTGYYQRPEVSAEVFDADGFYRTGDVMAQVGPDSLVYLDRRNNVLKLAQGEFVAVSKLEPLFADSPLIRQAYVYGNSARAYLLAVIVPAEDALTRFDPDELKARIMESLQQVAKKAGLQSYEIPRDFLIETTPWTLENGLLTGTRKPARPQLKKHYGQRLEQLYTDLEDGQAVELRALRLRGADAPVLETVSRAAEALLGSSGADDVQPDTHFTQLGGDSLSALTFGNLLQEIFDVEVPVSVIVSPANDLQAIADYIEAERKPGAVRPTFAAVHGSGATEVHARDLTLDKFLDAATLAAAPTVPGPRAQVRTVLLTGATGFLGRYLALEWLERMNLVEGKVIALVRAKSDEEARARLDRTFDSGDPKLLAHYQELAARHLEIVAGDKGEANLGLDTQTWQRLADSVDLILDSAALVNHVLPYSELFGPNTMGTAELIRIALSGKQKPYIYVSTISVGDQIRSDAFIEDADVREISPTRRIDDSYANGYGNSKWAGEVLLREAHDLCGLPVAVFRCGMILADTSYAGQLNLPDMFTRMMLSLVAAGVAPGSFYELDADGARQRAHHDGLPVEFMAEAISTLGATLGEVRDAQGLSGFETYHAMNPYADGIGFDEFVDWLISYGCSIERIDDYAEWLRRFETSLHALPEKQRHGSLLPLLHNYRRPETPFNGAVIPTDRFRAAVQDAKVGPDKDIPHLTPQIITKYVTDLRLLGLL
ncbi:carboxylic acid reductase [Mycobacterium angelicum]|uniref:Carboxylic acid reductase n=1 Tax=Mycobacterium angelicum TaxID=470074 RepID=A0A1W9ZSJ9_MYCAN|nr:carboxylic acid reductase [Mycobacterium angelicum]MCV7196894.1 thioester reductase domain-containing protein [Mycobacterium angelicum]ORA20762.1 oxidoreductase [Mycobacterium angelicum]